MTLEAAGASDATAAEARATPIRVIFIDTGNSARSQMAEALLRKDGGDRFTVDSAGVTPRAILPLTIDALAAVGIDISDAESKPVGMFVGRRYDYVITLCDKARVTCPVFPGGGETLHWGLDDPFEASGSDSERRVVFDRVLTEISLRLRRFIPVALAGAGQ